MTWHNFNGNQCRRRRRRRYRMVSAQIERERATSVIISQFHVRAHCCCSFSWDCPLGFDCYWKSASSKQCAVSFYFHFGQMMFDVDGSMAAWEMFISFDLNAAAALSILLLLSATCIRDNCVTRPTGSGAGRPVWP